MDGEVLTYTGQQYLDGPKCDVRRETPLEQLTRRKHQLKSELARVDLALDTLNQHPEITKVMEIVAKAL